MLVFRRRNKSRASLFCEFQFATASTISYAWWDYMAKVFEMSDIFTIEFPWSTWTILQMNWWEPVFNVHQVEPPRFQLNKFSCLIVYVKFAFEDTQTQQQFCHWKPGRPMADSDFKCAWENMKYKSALFPANIFLDKDAFRLRLQKTSSRRLDQDEYIRLSHKSSECLHTIRLNCPC